MAQKITVALEDDLDGGPADETVRFGLGGTDYEIDLSTKNANAFRRQLAPFIEHARKTGRGQRRRPGRTVSSRERSADIRAWAKDQGIALSGRGRIPASVVQQYKLPGDNPDPSLTHGLPEPAPPRAARPASQRCAGRRATLAHADVSELRRRILQPVA
jgi:hypothetical protein